jgi:hypothetical protein
MKQTHWALGSMEREEVEPGLFCGTSLFTYNKLYIRIATQPELCLVDYYTGTSPASLRFGMSTRVIDSSCVGEAAGNALIVMTTWRHSSTSDADWELKSHFWPTEIALIKARIDTSSATPNRRQQPHRLPQSLRRRPFDLRWRAIAAILAISRIPCLQNCGHQFIER